MEFIIYGVGVLVVTLLLIYALLYVFYRALNLDVKPVVSFDSMPLLKPVPIPTKKQKTFLHKLVVFVFEVRNWELTENWHYKLNGKVEIVIPKGFRFEGASIPRPLWALLSPTGLLLIPGLIHDYAYKFDLLWEVGPDGCPVEFKKGAGKDYWDQLFKDVGDDVNGVFLVNAIATLALTLGGGLSWSKHRQENPELINPELEGCD